MQDVFHLYLIERDFGDLILLDAPVLFDPTVRPYPDRVIGMQ